MRLLFVNNFHIPQIYRGTEVNTHSHCVMLKRAGHEVSVLAALEPRGALGIWSRAKMRVGGQRAWAEDRLAGYPTFRSWHVPSAMAGVVRQVRPDVLVLQTGDRESVAAAAGVDVPSCLYFHHVPTGWSAVPDLPLVRHVTNSLFCQRRIEELFGLRSSLVRPLVLPWNYETEVDRREVTAFGLTPDKGTDILLAVAERLPEVPFRIFANQRLLGEHETPLMERASRLPNVTVSPPLRTGRALYRRTRVVMAPSRWEETWGRMATEAHCNEIPVLASDRGGLPEAVGPGGACLSVDAPVEAWCEALRRMFGDAEVYDGYRAAIRLHRLSPLIEPASVSAAFLQEMRACAGLSGQPRADAA